MCKATEQAVGEGRQYTPAEVAVHNHKGSCWIVVDSAVYERHKKGWGALEARAVGRHRAPRRINSTRAARPTPAPGWCGSTAPNRPQLLAGFGAPCLSNTALCWVTLRARERDAGDFVRETMAAEGVHVQELCTSTTAEETLVCWVLVDPHHRHSFCSRFDLTSEPLLRGLASIPPAASATIHAASALVVNGFVFDEVRHTRLRLRPVRVLRTTNKPCQSPVKLRDGLNRTLKIDTELVYREIEPACTLAAAAPGRRHADRTRRARRPHACVLRRGPAGGSLLPPVEWTHTGGGEDACLQTAHTTI
jgi:hypothetical protein